MDSPVDNHKNKSLAVALLLALGAGVGAAYWFSSHYDVRFVRRGNVATTPDDGLTTADAAAVAAPKPAPIVIRLACVDAENALRNVKTPRSLRDQLRSGDKAAPRPIPNQSCRPSSNLPVANDAAAAP